MSESFASSTTEHNLGGYAREYIAKVKGGDMGALPAILLLVVLGILFSFLNEFFLTKQNFANLLPQSAELVVLTVAMVFLIILTEIDLSAGVTGGVGMAAFTLLVQDGWPWPLGLLVALLIGAATGFVIGNIVARLGVPAFVVTLAFYLGYQGLMLEMLGDGGIFRVETKFIRGLMIENMPAWGGWLVLAIAVALPAAMAMWDRRRRAAAGVANQPIGILALRMGTVAVIGAVAVYLLNQNRAAPTVRIRIAGVPKVVPVVLAVVYIGTFVLDRTKFGRYLYAVGGNPEAARRAGINVKWIRISGFMICSTLAIISGVFHAAQVSTVESTAGRQIVLSGVGAAVVGGVSLFGGRGRLSHAAIGALVIAMIDNGLGLLGLTAGVSFMVTGGVLILAATVDALARRRKMATGR